MLDLSIAQATFDGEEFRARSANFPDDYLPQAAALCKAFGSQPVDDDGLEAMFAQPFGKDHVAVVQVAASPLRFRFLFLGRELYFHLHDPFAIAARYSPDWSARGRLSELEWPPEPLPRRTAAMLDEILKHGEGPFLLGAAQTLVDGGKILIERPAPETKLLRDLWALLPASVRRSLWPATFAFSNELGFDLLVMPKAPEGGMPGYLTEDQTRDYPDSRYERHLQIAIEANDQNMLDGLLNRKSTNEMIRLALLIIAFCFGVMGIIKALTVMKLI